MIEPGFPTLLAYPVLSYALAALAIALLAALLVRAGQARAGERGQMYWRRLALLSEVLLALGLIGLIVFAGRVTQSSRQVLLEQRLRVAENVVDTRLRDVVKAQCAPPPRAAGVPTSANLTPFNPGVAANELCALARARPPAGAGVLAWQMAAHALRDFGERYPGCVDNVFSRNNDCESTVGAAVALATTIDQLGAAMQEAHHDGASLLAVQGGANWGFALLAAVCAAAGMAIRIARAAALLFGVSRQ